MTSMCGLDVLREYPLESNDRLPAVLTSLLAAKRCHADHIALPPSLTASTLGLELGLRIYF